MKGQVLAVDFEKRELKDTQHKSDNDKQSFYINKTKICNDAVTIFQTAKSGGIWHMRAYIAESGKYHQKSLRTKDLIEDGRSRGREYDLAELESHSAKAAKKYWKVHDTVVKRLEKKAQKENAIFDRAAENDKHGRKGGLATIGRKRIDYMSDEHIREAMLKEGYVKTFEQRTRRKQSIRTNTHKLLNKAQANIEAVEKGTFGVGHWHL